MKKKYLMILAIVLAAVVILPVGANACTASITITATEAGELPVSMVLGGDASLNTTGQYAGKYVWTLDSEVPILDDGGAVESLKLIVGDDPEVGVDFGVRAGNSAMTYSFFDGLSFDPVVNPLGEASAAITLTDRSPAGAKITGLFPGSKANQAIYNGSTVFANLVNGLTISGGSADTGEDTGIVSLIGTVSSLESEFNFTLSAHDAASGTSDFSVTPEPATVALLGLGGLALLRRKRATN